MRLDLFVEGKLGEFMKANAAAVDEGGRKAMRRITFGARNGLRNRIKRSGLKSPGIQRLVVAKVTGHGLDLTGEVKSIGQYRPGGARRQTTDLVRLFDQGATIRAASGTWLAVPTGQGPSTAGRGGSRLSTPDEMKSRGMKTHVVPSSPHPVIIWTQNAGHEVVTHVLVRQVTIRSRYKLGDVVQRWEPRFGPILVQEIEKAAAKRPILLERR